jgi:hypothetical protein
MNEIISTSSPMALPAPRIAIDIRPGEMRDLAFIDSLQHMHTKQVGFMPTKALEGKIKLGHVLVAESNGERVGYLMGNDQYYKRDDLGIIFQMNVLPGKQRGLIGASLLKAQFERSAYGCKLYCCWCAQDLHANKFWEACGFVPLAFRTGARTKGKNGAPRMHIFWQKRIREGDTTTPWWFPSQTSGGAMMEDRLVFPIPPGTHWSDAMPIVLPGASAGERMVEDRRPRERKPKQPKGPVIPKTSIAIGGLHLGPVVATTAPAVPSPEAKGKREPKAKPKNDPKYIAAARELRDRWMEQQDRLVFPAPAKHDVRRMIGGPSNQTVTPTLALPEAA